MIENQSSSPTSGMTGLTALVTGGGSGIGRAIAVALAEQGLEVIVVGRRPDALAATATLHPSIRSQVGDVSDPADLEPMVEAATAPSGGLDVLINNAGVGVPAGLGRISVDVARQTWATNVLGPTLLAQAALPYLIKSRGSIINISSTFGTKPAPGHSLYGASKAALEQLTRSWALELAEHGIRVNAVAPGRPRATPCSTWACPRPRSTRSRTRSDDGSRCAGAAGPRRWCRGWSPSPIQVAG